MSPCLRWMRKRIEWRRLIWPTLNLELSVKKIPSVRFKPIWCLLDWCGSLMISGCKYTIAVLTGNRWAADTEADLFLILHGTLGNSEKLWLRQDPESPKFQQHSVAFNYPSSLLDWITANQICRLTPSSLNQPTLAVWNLLQSVMKTSDMVSIKLSCSWGSN